MASTIAIEDAGQDRPWLVMVHGMSQDHRVFDKQIEAFSASFRILLIDLPGHGVAAHHDGPYGHLEFAGCVAEALLRHQVLAAHYWGTHTGTAAGLLAALEEPRRIASLILEGCVMPGQNLPVVVDQIAMARRLSYECSIREAIENWWERGSWFEYMRAHPDDCRAGKHYEIVSEFSGRPWLDLRQPMVVKDVTQQVSQISTPTLIYNGESDHPEFLAEAERLCGLMQNAQRSVVAHSGGFPAWERPHAVNSMVAKFLDGVIGNSRSQ